MKTDYISLLEIGGERAVADLAIKAVEEKPETFRDILDLCFLEKYPLSMRASRAVQLYCEKYPEAIYPFLDEVVEKAIRSDIIGVRRNFLKIFAEFIDIRKITDPGPLLNACFEWLLDAGLPPGVRVHAAGVIYKLGLTEPVLHNELRASLEIAMEEGETSIKTYGRNMMKKLTDT
jgi:hypothetical protein